IGATQQEDMDAAFYAFNKIIRKGSQDQNLLTQTQLQLASLYQMQGDIEEADLRFDQALGLAPEDPNILNQYAYHLALRGDRMQEAKEMLAKARKIQPQRASFLITEGLIAYQQGAFGKAVTTYESAIKQLKSPDPTLLEHYGDALYKNGNTGAARQQWEKAKQLGASTIDIEKKLREL
ncbi:MAG: tetratricopeptide repeat protein, partial [Bacteroidota bacterium]